MSTNDELDTLTDAELSGAFAREYLGWTSSVANAAMGTRWWSDASGSLVSPCMDPDSGGSFATSADAVLSLMTAPHIEQFTTYHVNGRWTAIALHRDITDRNFVGYAPTFARAACIALLKAKRAEKGQP